MISRRDAAGIGPKAEATVLAMYGLSAADLLGQGTEAKVYALDADRVLKIYADPAQYATLETLRDFYQRLTVDAVPFALPSILSITAHENLLAVVERRIDGVSMENFATAGNHALEALYVDTVAALSAVRIDPPLDRHMLLAPDTVTPTRGWNSFLRALLIDKLPAVLPALRNQARGIDRTVQHLLARLHRPYQGPIGVIHGDLYPGNILMTDETTVAGIVDFGTFTMIGDPLFDIATACGYYRMYEPDGPQVRRRLLEYASAGLDADRREDLITYLLSGAVLSCDLYPQVGVEIDATGHFHWAAQILREGR